MLSILYQVAADQPPLNVTPNFSPWQFAATAIVCVGAFFFVADYATKQLLAYLNKWLGPIQDTINRLEKKQDDLKQEVTQNHTEIQGCIHEIPGHPENPNGKPQD